MVTHLKACKLDRYIESALAQDASEDDTAKDSLAFSQIHQAINMLVFGKIATADTAKEAWDILEKTYKGINRVQQNNWMMLKRKFELVTTEKSESIESYFSSLSDIRNEMKLNYYNLPDRTFVEKVLNTLPMKFDNVVAVIQETKGSMANSVRGAEMVTITEVVVTIIIEAEEVHQILDMVERVQCYNCEKLGHRQFECRLGENVDRNFQANVVDNQVIVIMSGKKELFVELDESICGEIKFGNKPVIGKGKIPISLKNGSTDFISDVFYVLGLHQNLLSMNQLIEKKYLYQEWYFIIFIDDFSRKAWHQLPTRSVPEKTPEEVWSGRKPFVGHLRVFRCIAYSHISDQLRKTLDDKGEKCVFIGYSEVSRAYRLYNPVTKRVIVSRDMNFDERSI
ncbi:uncharacterized protein LOC113780119 [Coffea eugenioides]|uniref:uncharacterized protein LOC113780119 n=1 Tax=Coffea eugenioides TaxID=49369 RepID=UPI000F606039|nr:uncharacterized protein LOC113780119 [Coffea eugenioides]